MPTMATVIYFQPAKARLEARQLTPLEQLDRQIRDAIISGLSASTRGDTVGIRSAMALLDILEARETGLRNG
jgi:hypothetical protein